MKAAALFAVDSNVLIALLGAEDGSEDRAERALEVAAEAGALVISPVVYAELLAAPGHDEDALNAFLHEARITVDWTMTPATWRSAALAYRAYAERRRRILADFVIGAHALDLGASLLTFDHGIYRSAFPSLSVLEPQ